MGDKNSQRRLLFQYAGKPLGVVFSTDVKQGAWILLLVAFRKSSGRLVPCEAP